MPISVKRLLVIVDTGVSAVELLAFNIIIYLSRFTVDLSFLTVA
jgi:hypothetical protein